MNIQDIKDEDCKLKSLADVIERQKELLNEYKKYDKQVNFVDINDYQSQQNLKFLIHRITEEIAEAHFADSDLHKKEELIDAAHFAIEIMLILSFDEKEIIEILAAKKIDKNENDGIMGLLYSCNFLKNKPWKKTQMETDEESFKKVLKNSLIDLFSFIKSIMPEPEFIRYYDKKSQVNKFRIRSNY